MTKIAFLKTLDSLIGSLLAALLPRPRRRDCQNIRSVLLIRPGGMGDALLLAPTVRTLREQLPGVAIDVLAERRNGAVFSMFDGVRRVYCYDRITMVFELLRQQYDVVIDTEQWYHLSAVFARLVRSAGKVGFGTNRRRRMFTEEIEYDLEEYEADCFARLLAPLGVSTEASMELPLLSLSQGARDQARALLDRDSRPGRIVVLFPGASVAEKRWGPAKFHALAERCEKRGERVVLVGGQVDRSAGALIALGLDVLDLTGRTNLELTAAVLEQADVLVSADSGLLHLAVMLGRPTVALFGASSTSKWAPRGDMHAVIDKRLCAPCSRFGTIPSCQHEVRCMAEIGVDDVTVAIETIFSDSLAREGR